MVRNQDDWSTIMIQKKTRDLLGEQRITSRESYDEVLTRVFGHPGLAKAFASKTLPADKED
jgi:hypothetical protein